MDLQEKWNVYKQKTKLLLGEAPLKAYIYVTLNILFFLPNSSLQMQQNKDEEL